ncbi:MAG: hypothetical protein ACI4VL_04105 [Bacilli bacterium]
MKLNNKGFAITSVLYGLLILFVVMTSSYLTVLSAKKNRLDNITKEIEDSYNFNNTESTTIAFPYTALYTGKYVFSNNCYTYLAKGNVIESADDIKFTDDNCSVTNEVTIYYYKGE